ncbi:MAG: hypothetical protein AAGE85_17620 [Pseudomonadota bacterium]
MAKSRSSRWRTAKTDGFRLGLLALLSGFSLPALAASSFNLGCSGDKHTNNHDFEPSIVQTMENISETRDSLHLIAVSGIAEKLTMLKSDRGAVKLAGVRGLGRLLKDYQSDYERGGYEDGDEDKRPMSTSHRTAQLRSAALADALERRQQRKLALPGSESTSANEPNVETRLPGMSEKDALIYRREMYRTDI